MATSTTNRWMQRAVKHPGAATRAAKRAGQSVQQWARSNAHSSNPTTRGRAQFALRAKAIANSRKTGR